MPRKAATKPPKGAEPPGHAEQDMIALARVALVEITPEGTFTDVAQVTRKEGVVDVTYPCTLAGYPGWTWTITLSDLPGIDPSVLELELLPGDGALLSPPWVPWADRLEDYLVAEKELDQAKTEDHDSSDDSDDEDEDDDFDGDMDGIDIDQLDLDLDPAAFEVPGEPNDVFDHVDMDQLEAPGFDDSEPEDSER